MSNSSNFIDLSANVVGTLYRIRWVDVATKGKKAKPFLACAIKAFHGNASTPNYTYFDLIIPAAEAKAFVSSMKADSDAKREIFVEAFIGDLRVDLYERPKASGSSDMETASIIKGRLLKITPTTRQAAMQNGRFELNVRGVAYVNSLFAPRGDKPNWMVNLSAMHGEFGEMDYTPFQLACDPQSETAQLLAALQQTFSAPKETRKKVVVSFKAKDAFSSFFTRNASGSPELIGQIRGAIEDITYAKIGEEVVYRVVKQDDDLRVETSLDLAGSESAERPDWTPERTGTDNA